MEAAPPAPLPVPVVVKRPPRWLPLIGLLAVIGFVTFGGFLFPSTDAGSLLSGEGVGGNPVPVAGGVTIEPAEGWGVADSVEDPPGILLNGGSGWLLVGVPAGTGTLQELLQFYVSNYLEPEASQLQVGAPEGVALQQGTGLTAPYIGVFEGVATPIEGEVIAVIGASGTGVILDGWAPQGTYGGVKDDVRAMAQSLVLP